MPVSLLARVFAALALVWQPPLSIPEPTGMVNDFAGVVSAEQRARMEGVARQVRDRSGGEIAVVTLRDIGDRDAGDVALQIGRQWRVGRNAAIGDSTRNTGLVVLLVPKETSGDGRGKFAISTGQGTEGFITDAESGTIRRESLSRRQAQAYGDALELTVVRIAQLYGREFGFTLDSATAYGPPPAVGQYDGPARGRPPPRGGINPVVALVLFFVLISVLSSFSRRGRRSGCGGCGGLPLIIPFPTGGGGGGGWSSGGWGSGGGWGGGGGGGFGGFGGGGGFSGGGSSDSW